MYFVSIKLTRSERERNRRRWNYCWRFSMVLTPLLLNSTRQNDSLNFFSNQLRAQIRQRTHFLSFSLSISRGSCFRCDANFQLVACHCDKSLYSSHHKQYNLSLTKFLISTLKMAGRDLDENGEKKQISQHAFNFV